MYVYTTAPAYIASVSHGAHRPHERARTKRPICTHTQQVRHPTRVPRTRTHARTNVPVVIRMYPQDIDKDKANPELDDSSIALTGCGDAEDPDVPTRVNTHTRA